MPRPKPSRRPGNQGNKRSGKRGDNRSRPSRADGPLELQNPHAALVALKRRPQDAVALQVSGEGGPAWNRVLALVQEHGIRVEEMDRSQRDSPGDRGGRRTGVALAIAGPPASKLNAMLAETTDGTDGGLWLALEQVQDPRNLGAIFRSAAFFGVRGVILTKDRSASLTAIACDTAAGGADAIPHCVVTNLARTLEVAREEYALRVVGASEHAEEPIAAIGRGPNTLLVLGNEEKGLRRLTRERCDRLAAIPAGGSGLEVGSLNVSVAAGVLMHSLTQGPQ